jgi:hypothetical protein
LQEQASNRPVLLRPAGANASYAVFAMRLARGRFSHASDRQHFALPVHLMNAACHRAILQERFAEWYDWTATTAVSGIV